MVLSEKFEETTQNIQRKTSQLLYDVSHGVRERPEKDVGSEVWVTNSDDKGEPIRGVVSSQAETPRSYAVHTPSGQLRRNSQHLVPVPEERTAREKPLPEVWATFKAIEATIDQLPSVRSLIITRQRSGIKINPPIRYREDN